MPCGDAALSLSFSDVHGYDDGLVVIPQGASLGAGRGMAGSLLRGSGLRLARWRGRSLLLPPVVRCAACVFVCLRGARSVCFLCAAVGARVSAGVCAAARARACAVCVCVCAVCRCAWFVCVCFLVPVRAWPPCLLRPRVPLLVARLYGPRANPKPKQTNELRAGGRMVDGWGHPRVRCVAAV